MTDDTVIRSSNGDNDRLSFNVNYDVYVRLTQVGRMELQRQHFELYLHIGKLNTPYVPPVEDAGGWSKWSMWDLMNRLGPLCRMGCDVPFETTVEFDRSALKPNGNETPPTSNERLRVEMIEETVHQDSLSITHIFDGEEVVTGGADGQVWVATFASALNARDFVGFSKDMGLPVKGLRRVFHDPRDAPTPYEREVIESGQTFVDGNSPSDETCEVRQLRAALGHAFQWLCPPKGVESAGDALRDYLRSIQPLLGLDDWQTALREFEDGTGPIANELKANAELEPNQEGPRDEFLDGGYRTT